MKRWLLLGCWVLFLAPAARVGESVVYSVTTSGGAFSLPISKTEILAIELQTGKLFSAIRMPGSFFYRGRDERWRGGRAWEALSQGIELVCNAAGAYSCSGTEAF